MLQRIAQSAVYLLCVVSSAYADTASGVGEAIARSDLDGRQRYELNLFRGKYTGSDNSQLFTFSGGAGFTEWKDSQDLSYVGGVATVPSLNNLIAIVNYSGESRQEGEYQSKVNINKWLAVNIGYTRRTEDAISDSKFAGAFAYLPVIGGDDGVNLLLRGGAVDWEGASSVELSTVLSNKTGSVGGNWNEEQFRVGVGVMNPNALGFEALWVDSDIGQPGPQVYMLNFTTFANHPFLSNAARESRILGVTSTSAANPILRGSNFIDPYIFANFNRLQFVQDIGDVLDVRYRGIHAPNGTDSGFLDVVPFPASIAGSTSQLWRSLFVGPAFDWSDLNGTGSQYGFIAGVKAVSTLGNLKFNLAFRNTGLFQSDKKDSNDLLSYLSYSF